MSERLSPVPGRIGRRDFLRNSALGAAAAVIAPGTAASPATGSPATESHGPLFARPGPAPGSDERWRRDTALIWFPDGAPYFETPRNAWCCFRKTFELPATGQQGTLWIFADARYRLFVNGSYVARGPARSDPRWQHYDVLDLTPHLRPGRNLIAVQVLHYGYGTGQHQPRVPGLAAELRLLAGSQTRVVPTDPSWMTRLSEAFDPHAPRVNGCQGAIEIFDARRESLDWTRLDFDESSWRPAKGRLLGDWHTPYYRLVARDIALLEEREITAERIAAAIVLPARNDGAFLPVRIRAELDQIPAEWEFRRLADGGLVLAATSADNVRVTTVDFGRVEPGYLQLVAVGPAGTVIDAVYAEGLWEGRAIFNPAAQRPIDRFVLAEGRNELEVAFAWKGFRYVHLLVRNPAGPVRIERVGVRARWYPLDITGAVKTPDAFQQTIFAMCERTLRICMQDAFVDSPSREQQQWMGDARWQAIYNYYLSGDPRLHRNVLRQIAQSQDAEGLTKSRYPDGHENWAPIPSYCLAWIVSCEDYHRFTGDLAPVRDWWPNLLLGLRWFTRFENEHSLLEDVPHWSYIDMGGFPSKRRLDTQRGGIITPLNLLYLEALHAAARLARSVGDENAGQHCSAKADRLRDAIRSRLWDEARGAYPDCWVADRASGVISEPTNALALLHLNDAARAPRLLQLFRSEARDDVVPSSPFFLPVVLRALIASGEIPHAWSIVRERYQPLVDAGSATTWEYWDLFYRNAAGEVGVASGSHAWGAGPLVLFFEGLVGLRALAPGFTRFALAPAPGEFTPLAFSMPTPAGLITGRCTRESGALEIEFTVPPGSTAVVSGRDYAAGSHRVQL